MRCASRTPPRRPEAGDPCTGSQDSLPQGRGGNGRTTRSKRATPAGRDCQSSEDLRAPRKEEIHRENLAVASGQARAKRRFKVAGTMFEVDAKYELIKPIGHGAYGVVISALNTENGEKVAIKKVTRAFDDLVDAKRILREITLLRKFSHDNIISIVDILVPPSPEEFEDVYIVSDLMETDLHRIINSKQELTPDHVQYFLYQILRALKYMHSSNVLHRDLKPSNLLLNSNCDLKVCDLGLARDIESGCQELTEYVVTRWYRAPEIMLACQEYSKAIDMWSVGCIFAELMLRRPFFPGDNYIDQLTIICDKLGKPKEDELAFVSTEKARRFIMKLSATTPRRLRDHFPETASEDALDLLSKMLEFSPKTRISVEDALRHPFLQSLHAAKEEPVANFEFCFAFEAEEPSKHRLQELMWEEMRRYHPEQGPWKGKKSSSAAGQVTDSPRVFAGLREGATSAAPLGRSPIKAGPMKGEVEASSAAAVEVTPSNCGAETSMPIEAGRGEDSAGGKSTNGAGLAAARTTNPATAVAAPVVPYRRTSSRAAALASAARAASRASAVVYPGVATTVPADQALTTASPPRGNGSPPALSSSALSGGDAPDDDDEDEDDDIPRARTRATARARVIKGRTTVLAPAQGQSSRGARRGIERGASAAAGGKPTPARWAPPAAAAVGAAAAAPIAVSSQAKPKTVAVQKRQRRGKPAGGDKGGSAVPCAEARTGRQAAGGTLPTYSTGGVGGRRGCRQGAPAEGSSESLSEGGFGHDPPDQAPSLFGKRKLAHQAGRAGEVGLVVPGSSKAASKEKAT